LNLDRLRKKQTKTYFEITVFWADEHP
jgi:hypothetical protein